MNLKGKYKKKVFKGSTFRPYWANYFSKLISGSPTLEGGGTASLIIFN